MCAGKCFTLMSPDIDDDGQLVDPVKVPWLEGGVFTTPPGVLCAMGMSERASSMCTCLLSMLLLRKVGAIGPAVV